MAMESLVKEVLLEARTPGSTVRRPKPASRCGFTRRTGVRTLQERPGAAGPWEHWGGRTELLMQSEAPLAKECYL